MSFIPSETTPVRGSECTPTVPGSVEGLVELHAGILNQEVTYFSKRGLQSVHDISKGIPLHNKSYEPMNWGEKKEPMN